MSTADEVRSITLYMIERHPLEKGASSRFRWIRSGSGLHQDLTNLIGPHNEEDVALLVDERPGGEAWEQLLAAVLDGRVEMVVTHLAPLTSAQRQQLIGLCAQTGVQLITPSDAGRNQAAT